MGDEMTAAEKAVQDIREAIDLYIDGTRREVVTLMRINRIIGHYDYERIGEGK